MSAKSKDTAETVEQVDPFDPESLRVRGLADLGVERVLTHVPVRKPRRTEFFRTHPDYVLDTLILERDDGSDRETYIVDPLVRDLVPQELRWVRLFVCINRRDTVFVWPAKLPREDNRRGEAWAKSALLAAEKAKKLWVRLYGDQDLGAYAILVAPKDHGEPQWPDKTFRDLLELAFRDLRIDRPDHPAIRELNGEL